MLLSAFTCRRRKDNGAGSLENQNGNFPAPQDFNNSTPTSAISAYDQPYNSTTSFVWELPFGRGRTVHGDATRVVDALIGGWQRRGINTVTPGEPVTLHLHARRAAFQVSGIPQDFRGANNYRPNVTCDPLRAEGERSITNWFNRGGVVTADGPEPAVRQRAAQQRRAARCSGRSTSSRRKRVALPWRRRGSQFRLEAFNLFNRTNFRAAERQPQLRRVRHDHVDLRRAADAARGEAAVLATFARPPRAGIGREQSRLFRQIDQDDIRVLPRAVEHDVFPVRRDVERPQVRRDC